MHQFVRSDDGSWNVLTSGELSRLQQMTLDTPVGEVSVFTPIEEASTLLREDDAPSKGEIAAEIILGDDAEFKESDHPRDPDGKFSSGGGGGAGKAIAKAQVPHVIKSIAPPPAWMGPGGTMTTIIQQGLQKETPVETIAQALKTLAAANSHTSVAGYANTAIKQLEIGAGLDAGSLGKAIPKPKPAKKPPNGAPVASAPPPAPAPQPAPKTAQPPSSAALPSSWPPPPGAPGDFEAGDPLDDPHAPLETFEEIEDEEDLPSTKALAALAAGIAELNPTSHDTKGPEPHPDSSVQQDIYAIAHKEGLTLSGKIAAIQEALTLVPKMGFAQKFGAEWIAKLGGAPVPVAAAKDPAGEAENAAGLEAYTPQIPAAPSAPAAKPGSTYAPASKRKRGETLYAGAKKFTSTSDDGAMVASKTLRTAFWNKVPPAARDAARLYTNGGYIELNSALRQAATGKGKKPAAHVLEAIDQIDELFEHDDARLTEDVVLRRGEQVPDAVLDAMIAELATGVPCRYKKDGFISTSMGPAAFKGKNVTLEIIARKGTPVLGVAAISLHKGEREMLMRHGQVFEVFEIHKTGTGATVRMYSVV